MDRREFGCAVVGSLLGTAATPLLAATAMPTRSKINWQKNLRSAHAAAVKADKPLLIVFGAAWCTFCHKLHRETFTDRKIISLIDRQFIAVALDFDKETKVVEVLEVEQLPCTIVLSPDADLLLKFIGYAKPDEYSKQLQSALTKRTEIKLTKAADETAE